MHTRDLAGFLICAAQGGRQTVRAGLEHNLL